MADFFPYRDGQLHAEAVPLAQIAAAVGTPLYVYSAAALTARYHAFADAFAPPGRSSATPSRPTRTWPCCGCWPGWGPAPTSSRKASCGGR